MTGFSVGCFLGDLVIDMAASFVVGSSCFFFGFTLRLVDRSCDVRGTKLPSGNTWSDPCPPDGVYIRRRIIGGDASGGCWEAADWMSGAICRDAEAIVLRIAGRSGRK